MSTSDRSLEELVIEILEEEEAAAAGVGIFRQRLEHQYGIEVERGELAEFLDELVDEGVMEYHHGEFREYTLPD